MKTLVRLYRGLCRRFGPGGMTISAWAWKHAQTTGNTWPRDRIDGLFLFLGLGANHCQSCFQRERATHLTHEGPRQ